MNDEVLQAVQDGMKSVNERLNQYDRALTEIAQRADVARVSTGKRHPLSQLGEDAGIKAMAEDRARSAIVKMAGSIDLMTKSTIVGDAAGDGEVLFNVPSQRLEGIVDAPRPRLSILDLLPRLKVSSNAFEYNRLDGYTNAADYQSREGDLKSQASLPTEIAVANIATIAAWIPASKQVLADVPALRQFVSNLLAYGVRAKLEAEVVNGAGGTGEIAGLTATGNFTAFTAATGASLADSVGMAQSQLDSAGWSASAVVVNPADWIAARMDRGDDGHYIAGTWRDPAPPSIWGLPVVTSAAIPEGDLLVMDTSQLLLLDRHSVTVEAGYAEDDFIRNKVRILAELRAGLAVLSPGAVLYGPFSG